MRERAVRVLGSGAGSAALTMLLLLLSTGPVSAQIPDEFTNLQHYPADISPQALIDEMRTISLSLGVRCVFCHVGSVDGASLEGVDFASDDDRHKRTARFMLGMVDRLNAEIDDYTTGRSETSLSCKSCHRGASKPQLLWQLLADELAIGGRAGLPAAYERAREHLTAGRYDFGEWELSLWAGRLVAEGRMDDAIAVLELNRSYHEGSPSVHGMLGGLYEQVGRTEDAIAAWRSVLEIMPDHPQARARLNALIGG